MPSASEPNSIAIRRRPLTGRGANTRSKLITAAIDCLGTVGYAATTTQGVAEIAVVSRGSLLHQFPTRLDLMAAAAEHAMVEMIEAGRQRFEALPTPEHRLRQLGTVVQALQADRAALALDEILLASRWEAGLAERLRPVVLHIEQVIDADLTRMAEEAGIRAGTGDLGELLVRGRLMIAAARGFTIELMVHPDRKAIRAAAAILNRDYLRFIEELLARR